MTQGKAICKALMTIRKVVTIVGISACLSVMTGCSKLDTISEAPVQQQPTTKIFEDFEQMPSFRGGVQGLRAYLAENVKYPAGCDESCIQGRVIVSFTIEKDGSITEAKVTKSLEPSFDKEALRVVNAMPKWQSGKLNGKAVRVRYAIPVTFRTE